MGVLPWSRLGLRWNPFGEPPQDEVASLIVLKGEDELAALLRRPRTVVQIMGEAGRGKTARLRRLQSHFPTAPYIYLGEDEPLPEIPPLIARPLGGPALLLDEAQRLPRRRRQRLFREARRAGASLVIATHQNLSNELDGADLFVESITVQGLDPHGLLAILERRIDWARMSGGRPPRLTIDEARELSMRFGDDLRSLLDQLYEDYQHLLNERGETNRWRNAI